MAMLPIGRFLKRFGAHILVGVLALTVLVLRAEALLFDTNFYTLWEATNRPGGDHPYRDFYEWGVPLQAFISAGAQMLVGYRLIGEFAIHWLFIVAGAIIAFDLGLRLSKSKTASLIAMLVPVAILAITPTFH